MITPSGWRRHGNEVGPFFACFDALDVTAEARVILMTSGANPNLKRSRNSPRRKEIILICGHYEGIDERVKALVTDEISLRLRFNRWRNRCHGSD